MTAIGMPTGTTHANYTAQTPTLWATRLLAQAENRTFWHKFEGPEGSGMPIIRKDDLTKAAGDTIKTDMVLALTGAGVTGDANALHGNEEALKFRQLAFSVSDLAHSVGWTELTEQLITHDMRSTALQQLAKWLAGKLDDAIWTELTGGGTTIPTKNDVYAQGATSKADLTTSTILSLNDISDLKAYAQSNVKIEPLGMANGEEYYGLVVHPYVNVGLKKDTNYQQAVREGRERGDTNPLFTGATFVWDNVVGYVSNRVPTGADGGSGANVTYARNIFFGAQALTRGFAQYPDWREEIFDYGRQSGVATTMIKGEKLAVYDLSAAGDGSGNTAIGTIRYTAAYTAPVVP